MSSILKSIKSILGIGADDTGFDSELIIHINTILTLKLYQLGIGPETGFSITSEAETWDQFLTVEEMKKLEAVKTYVGLNVRLIFDPPSNSTHTDIIKDTINELEWRLNIQAEDLNKEE